MHSHSNSDRQTVSWPWLQDPQTPSVVLHLLTLCDQRRSSADPDSNRRRGAGGAPRLAHVNTPWRAQSSRLMLKSPRNVNHHNFFWQNCDFFFHPVFLSLYDKGGLIQLWLCSDVKTCHSNQSSKYLRVFRSQQSYPISPLDKKYVNCYACREAKLVVNLQT